MAEPSDKIMSIEELAEYLNVSCSTLYKLLQDGKLPGQKVGKRWSCHQEAIVNAVAQRDYASAGAVQVSVFADRIEVWNPGTLLPPLPAEGLRPPHRCLKRNVHQALYLDLANRVWVPELIVAESEGCWHGKD